MVEFSICTKKFLVRGYRAKYLRSIFSPHGRLAYTIVVRRLPKNDSITSITMESLNPNLLASAIAYPKGYFAFTQKGCCGGQAPNFFSSYPNGVQVEGPACFGASLLCREYPFRAASELLTSELWMSILDPTAVLGPACVVTVSQRLRTCIAAEYCSAKWCVAC